MKIDNRDFLLDSLAAMPDQFETALRRIPAEYLNWKPESWEGVPGEMFSVLEQACHLRDIEIDGYQVRFQRTANENHPKLVSIDGYLLAEERKYSRQNPEIVIEEFRKARNKTLEILKGFDSSTLDRTAEFEGYGQVTLSGLIWFLSSHDLQHLSCMSWLSGKILGAND